MSLTPPQELRDMVFYIWKIIDVPSINIDKLIQIISLDLYIATPPNSRLLISKAINSGYLIENKETEEVQLAIKLRQEFDEWQQFGHQKNHRINQILNEWWRSPINIDEDFRFNALLRDFIDETIWNKGNKFRSSWIQLQPSSNPKIFHGNVKEINDNGEILYKFEIDQEKRKITHNCVDFQQVRKSQKRFCTHLAAVLAKLYASNKVITLNLVEDLVNFHEAWSFT